MKTEKTAAKDVTNDMTKDMTKNVTVVIWGFGAMGRGIAEMLVKKEGVEIVGVCSRNPDYVGKDLYDVLGEKRGDRRPVAFKPNIKDVISKKCCDVALLANDSFVKKSFDKIKFCLENKLNVITIAEEMAYPKAQYPEYAEMIDKLAEENGVTVLGTGINPGFVLDLLIIALTGTCISVDSIKAVRVNDLSPFGHAVMHEQGVGISTDEFRSRQNENTLAGHVGFPESMTMIADGLGMRLDKIDQTKDPIISSVYRETPYVKVQPGNLAGVRQRAFGYRDGKLVMEMDHPQQVRPHLENVSTGDYITIRGVPNINLQTNPEIPGGIGTIAMTVNMIPHVINSDPGLKTMLDLPVPRAIMGDMRKLIRKAR